jgi:F-type H+-transporting ATPase subunit a
MTLEKSRSWRWGVNRWIILALVILGVIGARAYPPILPHVQLPAEAVTGRLFTLPVIGDFYLSNSLVAMFIGDVVLLVLALFVRSAIRSGEMVLRGIAGAIEALLEVLYQMAESTAGKWAATIFPWMATIVLLVLMANWLELIPGTDSIGLIHHAEGAAEGYPVQQVAQIGELPVLTIVKADAEHAAEGAHFVLTPFVRVASTDLNFTIGLALISVVMSQVVGLRALGLSYFSKFLNVKTFFSRPLFGVIDFGVGLLELISETSKILSFGFRLFGNIFAGSVLLFVIGSLIPVFAQSAVLLFEFFIGLIQALIFGLLTLVFMAQATAGHAHEEATH